MAEIMKQASIKRALFPGSFDPLTLGHDSVIRRALPLFDEIIIGIGVNREKSPCFSAEQRTSAIKKLYDAEKKIKVMPYKGLTISFCRRMKASFILRGLRTASDFDFERGIALMNREMAPDIETIFIISLPQYSAINSTIVRDIIRHGGDASPFVPEGIMGKS